jgi:uncharacterized protein
VLFDADKLDSLGAVGVARFFMFAGENRWDLRSALVEAERRMRALEGKGFCTAEGARMGRMKAEYARRFFEALEKEVGGGGALAYQAEAERRK